MIIINFNKKKIPVAKKKKKKLLKVFLTLEISTDKNQKDKSIGSMVFFLRKKLT